MFDRFKHSRLKASCEIRKCHHDAQFIKINSTSVIKHFFQTLFLRDMNSYRWYGKAFVGFLPIEFFREKLQKQFSFKVTASLYRIKSILRLGCCCRQCCCHCHLRLTADGDVYFFDTHYWLIQMMMDRKFKTYKINS